MQALMQGDIDDRTFGELRGLANELKRLEGELSDSKLKDAINVVVKFVVGGLVGYGIGWFADQLGKIEGLL